MKKTAWRRNPVLVHFDCDFTTLSVFAARPNFSAICSLACIAQTSVQLTLSPVTSMTAELYPAGKTLCRGSTQTVGAAAGAFVGSATTGAAVSLRSAAADAFRCLANLSRIPQRLSAFLHDVCNRVQTSCVRMRSHLEGPVRRSLPTRGANNSTTHPASHTLGS